MKTRQSKYKNTLYCSCFFPSEYSWVVHIVHFDVNEKKSIMLSKNFTYWLVKSWKFNSGPLKRILSKRRQIYGNDLGILLLKCFLRTLKVLPSEDCFGRLLGGASTCSFNTEHFFRGLCPLGILCDPFSFPPPPSSSLHVYIFSETVQLSLENILFVRFFFLLMY